MQLVDDAEESGVLEESQKELINNILEFDDTAVSEVMNHRTDIVAVEISDKLEDVLKVGQECQFKVIKVDRENKKVELSLKALLEDPKTTRIKELSVGAVYQAEVIKLLQFGAIVKVENDATGLLHISNCTENKTKKIYELVKVGDRVNVELLSKDEESQKVSFKLETLKD